MSKLKVVIIAILSVIVVLFLITLIYLNVGQYDAEPSSIEMFNQSAEVMDSYAQIDNNSDIGLIFYPGAKVDYRSYSYLSEIDNANVYIVDFPFNIAFFNLNAADDIIEDNPQIDDWFIMGHSLGGYSAINYALNNEDIINGVITLGGYPSSEIEDSTLNFYAFFATNDGLIQDYDEKSALFNESNSTIDLIEGGNHSQYGNYGFQKKDLPAEISSEEQQEYIITNTKDFIDSYN